MATVTNLAEIWKERLHVLADILAHAVIFVPGDLALDTEWRAAKLALLSRQRRAKGEGSRAGIGRQRGGGAE